MPKFDIDELDVSQIPKDVKERYVALMHYRHKSYYWLLFFSGCILFLLSATIL